MKIGMVAESLLCGMVCLSFHAARSEEPSTKHIDPPANQCTFSAANDSESQQYLLRYKFHPGDTLRWSVIHRCRIRTPVSGSTQTAETTTTSVKVWRVHEVKPDGSVVFDHMVESVDMRHRLSGRDEVHYNSRTD